MQTCLLQGKWSRRPDDRHELFRRLLLPILLLLLSGLLRLLLQHLLSHRGDCEQFDVESNARATIEPYVVEADAKALELYHMGRCSLRLPWRQCDSCPL